MLKQIAPHGGSLINGLVEEKQRGEMRKKAASLPTFALSEREVCDIEMIATGAMSPLEGFMNADDYHGVLDRMQLQNGLAWTLPVTKHISAEDKRRLKVGGQITLTHEPSGTLAIMYVEDVFPHDKKEHASKVYGTLEEAHPGVAHIFGMGDLFVGGRIELIDRPAHKTFLAHRRDPKVTRAFFQEKNWRRIVAFQTRNPIHRAHEYLQKCALEMCDGLLIHPLVGQAKGDDVPAGIRVKSYEVLIENYFPKDRALLSVFPAAMRYAGPREAIWHALVRKNYGCTHFIVGRDHAGVARPDGTPYYGSYDAQHIFDEFKPEEIGITPVFYEFTVFCRKCDGMVSAKTCPHSKEEHVSLSGTKLRTMLRAGELPPREIARPEVAKVLAEHMSREPAQA